MECLYKWKSGCHLGGIDPNEAGAVLSRLERDGNLTPAALVNASRSEDAPLHQLFEWDDTIAAEKYRQTQAGYIIRSIEVKRADVEPVRAFVSIITPGESASRFDRQYRSISAVLKSATERNQLLEYAKREMFAFKRKYSNLEELSKVITAIDEVL